jgi:hypothetical protein
MFQRAENYSAVLFFCHVVCLRQYRQAAGAVRRYVGRATRAFTDWVTRVTRRRLFAYEIPEFRRQTSRADCTQSLPGADFGARVAFQSIRSPLAAERRWRAPADRLRRIAGRSTSTLVALGLARCRRSVGAAPIAEAEPAMTAA